MYIIQDNNIMGINATSVVYSVVASNFRTEPLSYDLRNINNKQYGTKRIYRPDHERNQR